MGLEKLLHMNAGDGETSYANNSGLQKSVISKTLSVLDETLAHMFIDGFPNCFKIVDFGCASGPNTIFLISHIIDTIKDLCKRKNFQNPIEFQVFLNDLPDNDFNNLFKLMMHQSKNVIENGESRCFISGSPGSFYTRLFPSKSLHFAYSSYSLHWLSKVPEGIENKNKGNIYLDKTSPREVIQAYANQYERDFFTFLRFRAEEIMSGGNMVLTFVGRSVEDPTSPDDAEYFTILAETLMDMIDEGLIKEDDLTSFNVPIYTPCQREVEQIITREGSFNLNRMNCFRVPCDANEGTKGLLFDKTRSAKLVVDSIRAFMEPMMASHFGRSINYDCLFDRYAEKVTELISIENSSYFTIAVSLSRK